jgi:transposase
MIELLTHEPVVVRQSVRHMRDGGSLMQKKQDVIVANKCVFVGLEDSKRSWKLCVRAEGMIVHETSLPADYENLRRYLRGRYPGCRVTVMYEAGFGGFWLHDALVADGIGCVVTPAHRVTQEKVCSVKTDRVDARRLARNLESGDHVRCHVPDRERRENRQLVRTLNQVQRDLVRTKNRIRKFLDYHGLNAGLPSGAWRRSDYERLKTLRLSGPLQLSLDVSLRLLAALEQLKAELLAALKTIAQKARYRPAVCSKQSCVGVGWLSAIRFTLEWGDLTRFATGKQFAAYVGLTSCEYSTGEVVHRGRITGQGNAQVRAWLIQCAWRALSRDPVLLRKYRRVWHNAGNKKKAIVAVARTLAVRMRAVELSGQPYGVGVVG